MREEDGAGGIMKSSEGAIIFIAVIDMLSANHTSILY